MPVAGGPNTLGESNLVFAYDTGDMENSYKGAPTTNICTGADYSIFNDGATNIRNQTFPLPFKPGYEVVKVTANTPGTYGQSILWTATYSSSPTTATNSVYAWLESGDYVQVGQHWFPWNYGSPKYIEKGKWVRISETYAINEGGSYSAAGMVYSTNGVAYFCMPQYELKPYMTPFINFSGTRSVTQGLLPVIGNSTLDLTNVSFNSNAQMVFDGTNDYINIPSSNVFDTQTVTVEVIVKPYSTSQNGFWFEKGAVNTQYSLFMEGSNIQWRTAFGGTYDSLLFGSSNMTANAWNYVVGTYTAGDKRVYLNSTLMNSNSLNVTLNTNQGNQYIGSYNSNGYFYNGEIAVVKVYNRALTAQEIRQNYQQYKTRFNLS
jgi:hypothetical protein